MKKSTPVAALALSLVLAAVSLADFVPSAFAQGDAPAQVPVADLSEAAKAQQALEEFIQAYETGNIGLLRSRLDPGMIGYQRFIDGMITDSTRLKMIRINLLDSQSLVGPDVAMIQTAWEKRFVSTTGLAPGMYSGRSQFLMHRNKDGWQVAAVGGDNPFASQSGVMAQLSLSRRDASSFYADVVDPDVAGQGHVDVQVSIAGGAFFTIGLPETTPGHFRKGIEGLGTVIMRYMDPNPGGGRPPSLLTRSGYF